MKKKLCICVFILLSATTLFFMELSRGSQQDVSITNDYIVDHPLEEN